MLNFNNELQEVYSQVKADYLSQDYIQINYPLCIDGTNWDDYSEMVEIPLVVDCLYFILSYSLFDNDKLHKMCCNITK